jgi:PhzF family phenazine biosynthesis protein
MSQKIFQIDAFADALFSGNPAAVCPLENWLDADIMQNIATENNLAETAFTVPVENGYEIRWFTPEVEVDLCGHATLASACTWMNFEGFLGEKINYFFYCF